MKKSSAESPFLKAYNRLNPEQKLAVDTIEGPVLVIAGPGTGKTQILTLRIAKILLETDTKPEQILALTFTEAGAKAMRERLVAYIGSEAYRVPIHTFHGLAEKLIRQYPDSYPRIVGSRAASDLEKIGLIESILDGGDVKELRPFGDPSYYVRPILNSISTMKREYITPDDLRTIITAQEAALAAMPKIHEKGAHKGKVRGDYSKKEKAIIKNRELLFIYERYQLLLQDGHLYDFDDMIVETVHALEQHEDMLRDLQETYQYIHADEHQDVNGSQNRMLELLASYHEQPNIFVVGDEKQAIFRFQGASLENFLYFEDVFKGTKMISLVSNYRSGQDILDTAHSLVAVTDGPLKALRIPLIAHDTKKTTIERRDFLHQAVEDEFVVQKVHEVLNAGTPPEEVAVIVRTNREVEQLAEKLRRAGVQVAPSADSDILMHPITYAVSALIDAVVKSEDEAAFFTVLHGAYWNIPHDDLVRVVSQRNFNTPLSTLIADEERLRELKITDVQKIVRVHSVLTEARNREVAHAPHRVLEYILRESGFIEHVMATDPFEGVRTVRRLYDEIEEMVRRDGVGTLRSVAAVLEKRRGYMLPLNAPYIHTSNRAVAVMTAHKSKGLEFEVVILPHLVDNLWGGSVKRSYFDIPLTTHIQSEDFDPLDDEFRLLYVALTRAKTQLYLSHAETSAEGRPLLPSRLFDRLALEIISTEEEGAAYNPIAELLHDNAPAQVTSTLLRELFLQRGLSATHLNNYLKSPWDYFFRNMLRIPEVQPLHMQYGTALHGVLERITKKHTADGGLPTDTEIKSFLETALRRLPFTKEEYVRRLEKGLNALFAYVPYVMPALTKESKEEFSIRVTLEMGDAELPEVPLTGKLDRLDFDERGYLLRVVDYKTGKPKTRGQIEGKTKDSDGGYKRQLVFYALLLSLYDDERYTACRTMTLSFVEPDSKGIIREETFEITDEEVAELKTEIIRVAKEITTGSFLAHPCTPEESEYCNLAKVFFQK